MVGVMQKPCKSTRNLNFVTHTGTKTRINMAFPGGKGVCVSVCASVQWVLMSTGTECAISQICHSHDSQKILNRKIMCQLPVVPQIGQNSSVFSVSLFYSILSALISNLRLYIITHACIHHIHNFANISYYMYT